jgi:glucose uptake protein
MLGIFYALITILAWGTWLAPSQNIHFKNQQIKTFYVAVANLGLALVITWIVEGGQIKIYDFWPPFIGGLIWSVAGLCAFTATNKIGMARAFGVWAPINIIVSIFWGAVLFNEFPITSPLSLPLLLGALAVIITGVLMIIYAKGSGEKIQNSRNTGIGFLAAFGAGFLWGTYYIPLKMSDVSMWVGAFPLAIGIFIGSSILVMITRQPINLESPQQYLRTAATGVLWGIGNYGMLLLVSQLGAGRGFTISQLSVVVNALIGIYLLKDPRPRTKAAAFTLAGCALATAGGIFLGNLK